MVPSISHMCQGSNFNIFAVPWNDCLLAATAHGSLLLHGCNYQLLIDADVSFIIVTPLRVVYTFYYVHLVQASAIAGMTSMKLLMFLNSLFCSLPSVKSLLPHIQNPQRGIKL